MRISEILYHFAPKKVTNEIHLLLCFANFLFEFIFTKPCIIYQKSVMPFSKTVLLAFFSCNWAHIRSKKTNKKMYENMKNWFVESKCKIRNYSQN